MAERIGGVVCPFRKPPLRLTMRMEAISDSSRRSADRMDVVLARQSSPAIDIRLTKESRSRRFLIRSGQNLSEWYCQVWFDEWQHRGDRVDGVIPAQRLLAQYRREIAELVADGWTMPKEHR